MKIKTITQNRKKIKKRIFLYLAFFLIISFLLISYSINFNFDYVIDGGDTQLFLNPKIFVEKSLFVWGDTGTGLALPLPGINIFYATPLYLLVILFKQISIASFFYYVALFALAPISMFLLICKLTKDPNISFFIGLFYSFNLYTAILFHTPQFHELYFFGVTPLLILLFLKMIQAIGYKKVLFLLIYTLFFLPLLRIPHMFLIYLFTVPVIAFILAHGIKKPDKQFLKLFMTSSLIILLIALPFLLSMILHAKWVSENPISEKYLKSAIGIISKQKLINSFRLIGTYAWENRLYEEVPGIQAFSFAKYYQENSFFIFISFYVILLPIFLLIGSYEKLDILEKSKVITLFIIALMSLFVIQNTNILFGGNKFLITAFRSTWKYFTPVYLLSLSLITAILLKSIFYRFRNQKLLIALLLILSTFHLIYISPKYIFGKPLHQSWTVKIPNDYYELVEFLNQQNEDFRILPLPLTKHFAGYTPYKWGYAGPDVLYTLINKPLIDKYIDTVASNEYLEIIQRLEGSTPEELLELSKILNVKYILLRDDVDTNHPYIKLTKAPNEYKEFLENSVGLEIKNKKQFGNLTLYELKNYLPRIFIVPANNTIKTDDILKIYGNTFFKSQNINLKTIKTLVIPTYEEPKVEKHSPTKYVISLNNTSKGDGLFILFLTTYSPNWKAYISKNGSNEQISNNSHIEAFNFANAWYVNKTGNYTLTIEYEPQRWFYIGSAISIITFIACIFYLFYDWRKEKGDRWAKKIEEKFRRFFIH